MNKYVPSLRQVLSYFTRMNLRKLEQLRVLNEAAAQKNELLHLLGIVSTDDNSFVNACWVNQNWFTDNESPGKLLSSQF